MSSREDKRPPLRAAKTQDELSSRLALMERKLYDDLLRRLTAEIDDRVATAVNNAMQKHTRAAEKTLAAPQTSRELATISRDIQQQVHAAVIEDINKTLVPQINRVASWVNFQLQDTDATVDAYRRGVEQQCRSDRLMLTDAKGAADKRVLSPYVSTFFGEDD